MLAFPGLYARKPAFWLMILGPIVFVALLATRPWWAAAMLGVYAATLSVLAGFVSRRLWPLVLLAAPLHHLAYAVGFWRGIAGGVFQPEDIRRIRRRAPLLGR